MILLIDVGNSELKWSYWDSKQPIADLLMGGRMPTSQLDVASMLKDRQPEQVWVANVAGDEVEQQLTRKLRQYLTVRVEYLATQNKVFDLQLGYEQIAQLGIDRWLAMVASMQWKDESKLLADCGTAVTIDIVDQGGRHQGGVIIPGLQMMQRALDKQTHMGPSVDRTFADKLDMDLGRNTQQCVSLGAQSAIAGAIEYVFQHVGLSMDAQMRCILTGGDAPRIQSKLKIQSEYVETLVLQGMAMLASR